MKHLLFALFLAFPLQVFSQGTSERARPSHGSFAERAKALLADYDADKNGEVSLEEFKGRAESFNRMDANKDGKLAGDELVSPPPRPQGAARGARGGRAGGKAGQGRAVNSGPAVKGPAPDFTLGYLDSDKEFTLSKLYGDKPILLVFGSYTCPPFRDALVEMDEVYKDYKDRVDCVFIYILEAHAADERALRMNTAQGIDFKQPTTFPERLTVATACQKGLEIKMPVVVDTIDNKVNDLYAARPNRAYVLDAKGTIVHKGEHGPKGTEAAPVRAALDALLKSAAKE